MHDLLIRNAFLIDGTGAPGVRADVAVEDRRVAAIAIGGGLDAPARETVDAAGRALAPGFIDVHTHDDLEVIRSPGMLCKLSQGVTTVVVGNCGISASPVPARAEQPDPMILLGGFDEFVYPRFADYRDAVERAGPAVNVAALVGHTALRSNHMDRLDRAARPGEIAAMRLQLREALEHGALGLSTGLAYASAFSAPTEEVIELAAELQDHGGLYATHLRSESAGILDAMDEAYRIGRTVGAPVQVSHLKCAGVAHWGRSGEVLASLETAAQRQDVACDCYPYAASSSTLDLKQVTADFDILITWSEPQPEQGGRLLADIAAEWGLSLEDAATRLQPAGAVYYCMDDRDVRRMLAHPLTMIGSDGLPRDPRPHPRLWGSFPRVLGHYSREVGLFPLHEAVHKMSGLSARRFGLAGRGEIREGAWADLVLFDPQTVLDTARFDDPVQTAQGIDAVWVNGTLSYSARNATGRRAGRFLARDL